MSFSFTVKKPSKQAAIDEVCDKIDEVVTQQPIHYKDAPFVLKTVGDAVALLSDSKEGEIAISVHGSVITTNDEFISISIGVNAGIV